MLNNSYISQNPSQSRLIHDSYNNYPFGQESIRIANYVSEQMKGDEQNKKILEKFRLDAIKHRNQRVMQHKGRIPYITESMLPGALDPSLLVEKQPQRQYIQPKPHQAQIPPVAHTQPLYRIMQPRTKSLKREIGVEVDFEKDFPLFKKKVENKKKFYTIQNYQQQVAFDQIKNMLRQIHLKLEINSNKIEQKNKKILQKTQKYINIRKPKRIFTQKTEQQFFPTIQYTSNFTRNNSEIKRKGVSLQQCLSNLKKKRKRMDALKYQIHQQ